MTRNVVKFVQNRVFAKVVMEREGRKCCAMGGELEQRCRGHNAHVIVAKKPLSLEPGIPFARLDIHLSTQAVPSYPLHRSFLQLRSCYLVTEMLRGSDYAARRPNTGQ